MKQAPSQTYEVGSAIGTNPQGPKLRHDKIPGLLKVVQLVSGVEKIKP